MGMLDRYKKSGGFLQILSLIETCGPQKQEKFLKIIDEEDPRWAEAIRKKMLSVERILTWSNDTLAEIAGTLQVLTLATALHGLTEKQAEKLLKTFPHSKKRQIEELKSEKEGTPGEVSAAYMKIIVEVRNMVSQGYLRLDKVDSELAIEEDIEDLLAQGAFFNKPSADEGGLDFTVADAMSGGNPPDGADEKTKQEYAAFKKKLLGLNRENTLLKQEVTTLKTRLEKIKKLVA